MNRASLGVVARYLEFQRQSRRQLALLKGMLRQQTVFIIGTGPSLGEVDFSELSGRNVIYLNNAHELHSQINPAFGVVVVSDFLRYREIRHGRGCPELPLVWTTDRIVDEKCHPGVMEENSIFLMPKCDVFSGALRPSFKHGFSLDLDAGVYLGRSVVFPALQLAAHLGANKIVLLGVDMTMNRAVYYSGDIRSNFSGFDYVRDGKPHIGNAYDALLSKGCLLVNGVVGGELDVIPRMPGKWLKEARVR